MQTEITIPYYDVDAMDVVWHGHYVKYFELARCELLDSFGCGYTEMFASGYVWPIVDIRLKYVRPVRYNQKISITTTLVEWEYRVKITYLVRDAISHEVLTKGYTIQVAVDRKTMKMCMETPLCFREKLKMSIRSDA